MKIKPDNPFENDSEKTLITQSRSGDGGETGGGSFFDMESRGGSDDDPNGPPKAGASVSAD